MKIVSAQLDNLEDLIPLFDAYRIFYEQDSDIESARQFLRERFIKNDAVIYIVYLNKTPVGFTQLYPLYSSVSMRGMYLLNDLYIDIDCRGKGIGTLLIEKAKQLCKENGLKGLAIQTAYDNPAQQLYKRLGFVKDIDLHFFWTNENV